MYKIKILISILIFSILLIVTSTIKNQTRIIEKKINNFNIKIANYEKDLHEIELDYFYLSSPGFISKQIENLGLINYEPMEFSRIYLNYDDFISSNKKITNLRTINEKKK